MYEEWFLVIAHRRSELTLTFDIAGKVYVTMRVIGLLYLLARVFNYLKLSPEIHSLT